MGSNERPATNQKEKAMIATNNNTTTKHLQGIGRYPSTTYGEVKAGDVLVYNYGTRYTVAQVWPVGRSSVRIAATAANGQLYHYDRRKTSAVCIDRPAVIVAGDADAISLEACPASKRFLSIND
jgi:hypothetical protein